MINKNIQSHMLLRLFYSIRRSIAWGSLRFSLLPSQLFVLGGAGASRGKKGMQDHRQI